MNSLKSTIKTNLMSVIFRKTLIVKVKEQPSVWKNSESVDSLQRLEAWKSIQREMEFLCPCSLKEIQATWASLSEIYFRIIFIRTIERNFEAPVWQFFHEMSFLYDHVKETIQNMLGGISPPLFKPGPNSKPSEGLKCPCCVYDGPDENSEPDMSSVELEFKREDEAENIVSATKEASLEYNENSTGSLDTEKVQPIYSLNDNSMAKLPRRDSMKNKSAEAIQLINDTETISESISPQLPPVIIENVTYNHSSKGIIHPLQEISINNTENSIGCVGKVPAVSSLDAHSSKNQSKFITNSPKLQQNGTDNSLAKLPSKDLMKDTTVEVIELIDDSEASSDSTSSHNQPANLKNLTGNNSSKNIIMLPLQKIPLGNRRTSNGSEEVYAIRSLDAQNSENRPNIFIHSQKLHPNEIHNFLAKSTSTNLMKDNTVEVIELIDDNETSSVSTSSQFPLASSENKTYIHSSKDIIRPVQEKSFENVENSIGSLDSEKVLAVCPRNFEKPSELLANSRNIQRNETDDFLAKSLNKDLMKDKTIEIVELVDDNETSSESTSSQLPPAILKKVAENNSSKDIVSHPLQETLANNSKNQSTFLTNSPKLQQNGADHSSAKSSIKDVLKEKTVEVIELTDDNETSNESTISQPQPANHQNLTDSHSTKDIICRPIYESHLITPNSSVGLIRLKSSLSINDYLEDNCLTNPEPESHTIEQTQSPELSRKDSKGVLILSDKSNGKEITRLVETVNKVRAIKRSQIIEAIKANPGTYLYDGIKKRKQFQEAWEKVAADLNIPLEALKNRWKLIKTRYLMELVFERYKKQKSSWECFNQLEFLRPHMQKDISEIDFTGDQAKKTVEKEARKYLNSAKSASEPKEPLIENKKISNISNIKEIANNHSQLNIFPINVLDYVKRNQNIRIASVETLSKTNPTETVLGKRPTTKLDKPVVLDANTLPILLNRPVTVTAVKVVPTLNPTNENNNKEKSNENPVAAPPVKKLRRDSGFAKNGTNVLTTVTNLNRTSEDPLTTATSSLICLQQHEPQKVFPPLDLTLDEDLPVTVSTSALKNISTSKSKRLSGDEECVYTCKVPAKVSAIKVVPSLNLTNEDNNKEKSNENAVAQPPSKKLRIASGSDKNGTNVLAPETHTKLTSPPDLGSTLNIASEEPITIAKPICLQKHKLQKVFQPLDLTFDEDHPVTESTSPLKKNSTSISKRLSEDDECIYTCKVFPPLDLTTDDDNDDGENASKTEEQTATTSINVNKKNGVNVICLDDNDLLELYEEAFN